MCIENIITPKPRPFYLGGALHNSRLFGPSFRGIRTQNEPFYMFLDGPAWALGSEIARKKPFRAARGALR